jgi:protein BCP1
MDSDPYAILTLINMHTYHERPAVKSLAAYLLSKSAQLQPRMHSILQSLFSQTEQHVGLIICERLVNMPVQIVPPMYRMLLDELHAAIGAGKPFSYFIFLSRTYHLSDNEESELGARRPEGSKAKKAKKAKTSASSLPQVGEEYDLLRRRPEDGVYPFHPEDLLIMQIAECSMDYKFDKAQEGARDKDSFGLDIRGRAMLVKAEKFEDIVKRMSSVYNTT